VSVRAPDSVIRAATAIDGPGLLYDLAAIATRIDAIAAAARTAGVAVLAAAKAVPLAAVRELVAARLDGFDIAGPDEDAIVDAHPAAVVSVTFPGGADRARLAHLVRPGRRVIASCETGEQVATAAAVAGVEIALRVSITGLGETSSGGVRDAHGDHASRFGAAPDELATLAAVAPDRVRGLHLHGGSLVMHPERLATRARAALAAAESAGIAITRLDLGGSLHGFAVTAPAVGQARLLDALLAVRAAVPAAIEICVEPGRLLTDGCGYGSGRVLAARSIAGHDGRVLSLSRLCHLRWSTPQLCAPPPAPRGPRRRLLVVGATCCEDDLIADAVVPAGFELAVGELAVVAGVSGYAAAWNRGFSGVPAAHLVAVQ
jgi:diaminopimelate decarboxylase